LSWTVRGGMRLFQPNLHAANGVAELAIPSSPGRLARLVAPNWKRLLEQRKRLEMLGLGLGTDLSTDLGDSIGTRGWWLGMAACTSLCGAAIALGTMVVPLSQGIRPGLTPTQREAMRAQIIAPLALGGTTGTAPLPSPRLVEALAEAPERPRLELTARINGRDSFEALLRRAGVGQSDIADVIGLVRPMANLGALPKGSDVDIVLGRRESRSVPRPLELVGFRAAFDLRLAVSRVGDALQVKRIPIAIDSTPLRVQGLVGGNIERSLRSAGIPANLAGEFIKTMGYAVDFQHGVGKRDRFDIIVERDSAETGEVRYGGLMFAGLDRVGKDPVELGRFDFGGHPAFFRANGESARKGLMRTPVDGARLTSGFGMRFHPLLAYSRMHQGVDFGAPKGAPILAAASGTVAFAGLHGGHGNYVMLKHTKELNTGYAHMSRFAVRAGQSVTQGQVIGYVGSTGMSTGPHLHYEVWLRGKAMNPVALKFIGGTQLAGANLARFLSSMNRMRSFASTGAAVVTGKTEKRSGRRGARRA
jgi:murein DD-endopeptidase MepM/ murein hydrolase activator NlpD